MSKICCVAGSGQYGSMLLHEGESKKETDEPSYPLWGSCRFVYTICAFFCTVNLILMRFNISFSMVCMVSHPLPNETYTDGENGNHSAIPEGCAPLVIDEEMIREDRVKIRW